jgi:hypothetical protein
LRRRLQLHHDDLIAGISQAGQGAVDQDRVIEEPHPFFHGPVTVDDTAGPTIPGSLAKEGSTKSE